MAQGTSPVGVNFVLVNFNQPPTTITVNEAPLKYNKDFALSMQVDDANLTLFTHGYPVFEGGEVSGTTYPGLFYSNGCGDSLNFKMSSSVYVFNADEINGPDIHLDNSYGQLTWGQMDTIYSHNWGILNHGVNGNKSTIPSFMNYSISRNRSYIRRKMYTSTDGGVITNVFVNPDGNVNWTIPSFNLGNIAALNQNVTFPIGPNGGDVNAAGVDWTQPYSIDRQTAKDINVTDLVDGLANSSVAGANYWSPIYTHSFINEYLFNVFVPDFNYIANTYGINGLDNILMTTDEEILDYLIVRDATTLNYVINGTILLITYSGEVPDNLLYYSSSIVINSDATINNITIDGTSDYTLTGIGESNALININWDGYSVIPPEYLADSMVTIASGTQTEYDCWIAMDYVITMNNGSHKDSLRQVLCAIPNITYDTGFCNCEISIQPSDTTIQLGNCLDLYGAVGDYTYEWWIGDSLVDTTQNIYTCPIDTTLYNHIATNTFGCPALDSILVNINFLSFDLGPDTTICNGNCVTLSGPDSMAIYNWWVADTIFDTVQSISPCPIDTTQYKLWVMDTLGATAEDSITINVLQLPTVNLQPSDTIICSGDCIDLFGPAGNYTYGWYIGDSLYSTSQDTSDCPLQTTQYNLIVTDTNGCSGEDSIMVIIDSLNFDLGPEISICDGDSATISGPDSMMVYNWWVADTLFDTVQTIYPSPIEATQYLLQVIDTLGCTAEDSVIVSVRPSPIVSFAEDSLYACNGDNILITVVGSPDIDSYWWTYDGELIWTGNNNVLDLINPDTSDYVYVEGVQPNGCRAKDSVFLIVLPFPEITTSNDTTVCSGQPVTLSVSGGSIFRWIVGNDTISTNSTITVSPEVTTNYIAQTALSDSICFSEEIVTITIHNSATTEILYDTNIVCTYQIVYLTASGADHYLWSPSGDTNVNYSFQIFDTTTILLTGTTNDGCTLTDSVKFYTKPPPEVSFSGLLPVYCENDTWSQLTGTPIYGIFYGPGVVGDKFYPQSAGPGTHDIIYAYVNTESCTGYDTNTTIIYENGGSIDLGPNFTILPQDTAILDAGPGFDSYFWTTGATSQSIVVYGDEKSPGIYKYAVMGVINGCSTGGNVFITFENPDGYNEQHINGLTIFPNPNDGSFTIKFSSLEKNIDLNILNLHGKILYEKNNVSCNEECKIDIQLNSLESGIYFLRITTPKGVSTAKIVVN